jgi:hypothetical protein
MFNFSSETFTDMPTDILGEYSAAIFFHTGYLFCLFLYPKDGGDMFLILFMRGVLFFFRFPFIAKACMLAQTVQE